MEKQQSARLEPKLLERLARSMLLEQPRQRIYEIPFQHDIAEFVAWIRDSKNRPEIVRGPGDRRRNRRMGLLSDAHLIEQVTDLACDQAVSSTRFACRELESHRLEALIVPIDMRPDQLLDEFGRCHSRVIIPWGSDPLRRRRTIACTARLPDCVWLAAGRRARS